MSKGWRQLPCRRIALLVAAMALVAASAAWGQIQVNSAPNIVGSGARALGMGGAFIAVADDATAASWNPGGLTQLERPELSLVYNWKLLGEDFSDTDYISMEGSSDVNLDDINYLSIVYPFRRTILGRNLVVSLNYQRKYDFDRSLDFRARVIGRSYSSVVDILNFSSYDIDFEQDGHLSAISPAFGFELTDRLSVGMVMNIWDSSLVPGNEWERVTKRRGVANRFMTFHRNKNWMSAIALGQVHDYERFEDIEGQNYTFGLLFKPTERLSIGAVYHTAYSTDVEYTRYTRYAMPFGFGYYKSDLRIEWPSAVGVGVAYRFPNDKLTIAIDVTRRDWDRFVQIDRRGGLGARVSPISQMSKALSPHDPTYTIRLGAEYVFVDPDRARQKLLPSLRAGLMYDPEPASGRRDTWWGVKRGDGKPDDYYGVTLGAGLLINNRVNIDAAYEYRWGSNVRKDTLAGAGRLERDFDADVDQHSFSLSTVIYF